MGKPVTISFQFQTQAGPIPLSELDSNFSAVAQSINDFGTYGNYLVDTSGAPNTITVTIPIGTTFNYTAGVPLQVLLANTNTATGVQINVNALGNIAVQNIDGSAPAIGQLVAGMILSMQFNGTVFLLTGAASKSAGAVAGVTSVTGTVNQVTASPTSGAVVVGLPQNVVIPTPSGGTALTVTPFGTNVAVNVPGSSALGVAGFFVSNTTASTTSLTQGLVVANDSGRTFNVGKTSSIFSGSFVAGTPAGEICFIQAGGSIPISFIVGGNQAMGISGIGGVSIAAPSSGQALTVTGFGANGTYAAEVIIPAVAGTRGLYVHDNGAGATGFPFVVDNNVNNLFIVSGDGGVAVGPGTASEGIGTINVSTGYFVNGVALAAPVFVRNTSIETRTTTVTLTNSQLTFAVPAAGTYALHIVFGYSTAGTAGIGCAIGVNYSGTFTAASSTLNILGANGSGAGSTITAAVNSALASPTTAGNVATPAYFIIDGTLTATGTGTLSVAFAQSSSSATATSSVVGSYISITKIA